VDNKTADTKTAENMTAEPPRWHGPAALAAAAALLATAFTLDGIGRLLLLPAVAAVAVVGVRDLLLRPVLSADAEGLTVADGLHHRTAAWEEVERMRVVKDRRAPLLELDLGGALVVLGQRRLGRHPEQALKELEALAPGR
jgi:hypothetical protein